jgi:hypothetical protein
VSREFGILARLRRAEEGLPHGSGPCSGTCPAEDFGAEKAIGYLIGEKLL